MTDPLENPLSPIPGALMPGDTGPLTPLDPWFTEFDRVAELRRQAIIRLGMWHPPMLWGTEPPPGWQLPLPWPPRIVMVVGDNPSDNRDSDSMNRVLQGVDDILMLHQGEGG